MLAALADCTVSLPFGEANTYLNLVEVEVEVMVTDGDVHVLVTGTLEQLKTGFGWHIDVSTWVKT